MKHTLVVDDHAENRYLLRALLESMNHEVIEAENGQEALALARQRGVDLIISDLLMPGMDGYTLLRHWREDKELAGIPFMVYTATYTQEDDRRLALDLGADAFIVKPTEPVELMTLIQGVLDSCKNKPIRAQRSVADGNLERRYSQVVFRKLGEKTQELEERIRDLVASRDLVQRLNRLYAALSETNQAIVHIDERVGLFKEVCRIAVEKGGFTMAWIGELDETTGQIELVARHGGHEGWFDEAGPFTINPPNRTPVELTLSEKKNFLSNDLLADDRVTGIHETLARTGLRSAASLMLRIEDRVIGALTLYSDQVDFFDQALVDLVEEMAADVSFALHNYEKERLRKEAEAKLVASEESNRLSLRAIEASANGIMITDSSVDDHPIIYVNPAFEKITGYRSEEVVGRNPRFLSGDDNEQLGLVEINSAIQDKEEAEAILRNYRKDGSLFWNELTIAPVFDEAGQTTHFIGIMNDITDRKNYEEQLERQYSQDLLTGLASRNLLQDRTEQAIASARHRQGVIALIFIDLDQFKRINDSLGRGAGDEILRAVGERLLQTIDDRSTAARISSDEFVILLTDLSSPQQARGTADSILKALTPPIKAGDREVSISASIGISTYPDGGNDYVTLLRNADLAMFRAKQSGRSTFRFYTNDMNREALRKIDMETRLRIALEKDELQLHFQPLFEIATMRPVAAEALLRWQEENGVWQKPAEFIPLAEETGLIVPIGAWVLDKACQTARDWQDKSLDLELSVNLSARQFADDSLYSSIEQSLARHSVPADRLHLEITESIIMTRAEEAEQILESLKRLGIRISVDDFGTGYSSLAYLRRFPLDQLKIDQSFIQEVTEHRDSAAIVTGILSLANSLRLEVVAEGVESREQHQFLLDAGCRFAQGFYYARPMPSEELESFIHSENYRHHEH